MDLWLKSAFQSLATDNHFSDFEVIVESTTFKCHKNILACSGDYFKSMLLGDFKEGTDGKVTLYDVEPKVFEKFRSYIYTYDKNELDKCSNNMLMKLLECGDKWLVKSITEDCADLLGNRAKSKSIKKVDHIMPIFESAHTINHVRLLKTIASVLKSRFSHELDSDALFLLSSGAFCQCIIYMKGTLAEYKRFELIEKYIELYKLQLLKNPDHKMTEALESIAYNEMTIDEFYDYPGKSDLLSSEEKYEHLYSITKKFEKKS